MSGKSKVGYRFAGDIEIEKFDIISSKGNVTDITSLVTEISIYQNLFSHYLQCEIAISDGIAYLDSIGGFTGGEVIAISYKSKDKDLDFLNHFFGVYSLTDRQKVDEKIETYVLNCISIESYIASPQKISRAYGSNIISNMAKSVIEEFLYNNTAKDFYTGYKEILNTVVEKSITIDETDGLQKFIIPNFSPDETIDFFTSEADSDSHIPYYVFYEDSRGFNFRDLSKLIDSDTIDTFTYLQSNTDDGDEDGDTVVRDYQKIITFNVIRQTDFLKNINDGLFKSKTINLDILRKNKKEITYQYSNYHEKFKTLQPEKIIGEVQGDATIYMMNSRTGHDSDTVLSAENHFPKRMNDFISIKRSYGRHIFNTVLEVTLFGNSDLNVGNVIELVIPNSTTVKKSDKKEDKYLSGKYLITSLRNKFSGKTGQQFITILECVKDTGIPE